MPDAINVSGYFFKEKLLRRMKMQIDLRQIRNILKNKLGFNSFISTFIKSVTPKAVGTACIDKDGNMYYDQKFVEKYITTPEDLFSMIMHELMHPLFAHYRYGGGDIANIACDAIINAAITTLFTYQSNRGALFKKLYKSEGFEILLRPGCDEVINRFSRLYKNLYNPPSKGELTTGGVILSLKVLLDTINVRAILLLGNHGASFIDRENTLDKLPADILERIAGEIGEQISKSKQAGYSDQLSDLIMNVIKSCYTLKKEMLRNFVTRNKVDKFKEFGRRDMRRCSPIPLSPSKGDIVKLAAGLYPMYFHNRFQKETSKDRGIAIYLDVSGSVNEYLPDIIGVLNSFRNEITTIFQFSNKVVETTFKSLLKGEIKTTYGTDFNCIAESILDRDFEKAVVITDGYATLSIESEQKLKDAGIRILTILFDDADSCLDLEPFGPAIKLEDMKTTNN